MAERNKKVSQNSHPILGRRFLNRSQPQPSPSTNRKSNASSASNKSNRSRATIKGSTTTANRTDSRATRMSSESKKTATPKSVETKSTTSTSKPQSIDSRSTFPARQPSVTTTGRSSAKPASTKSATPCKTLTSDRTETVCTKTSTTQTRKTGRKGWRGAPSAYSLFVKSYFKEFRKKNPTEKIPFITLTRRCADKWHSLPNPIKQEFYRMSERAVLHYNLRKMNLERSLRQTGHRFYPIFARTSRISASTRSMATKSSLSKRTSQPGNSCKSVNSRSSAAKKKSGQISKFRHHFSSQTSTSSKRKH